MPRALLSLTVLLAALAFSPDARAGVWLELLYAPCWTGDEADIVQDDGIIGEYRGAIDCFNRDFKGDGRRLVLSLKAYQPWEYGSVFLYYDITGPFTSALDVESREFERGGFFGGITLAVSAKKVGTRLLGGELDWGPLSDVSLQYAMEHVSNFGVLHYYGLLWELALPGLGPLLVTTVLRNDTVFEGQDLQLGVAWERDFTLWGQGLRFTGFAQAGLFGEGAGRGAFSGIRGSPYFFSQPQLLWDVGPLLHFTPKKLFLGFEYQLAFNRYLIPGKTENVLQGMLRWDI